MTCCGTQSSKTMKLGDDACFTCLGCSSAHLLTEGLVYPPCSPLVAGETKLDPWMPMTAPDQCIVAWVGPHCSIDATDWTEPCLAHVYTEATAIAEKACWPADETGASIFTQEDIELIVHAHHCCISLDRLKGCQQAPEWLQEQNSTSKGKAA